MAERVILPKIMMIKAKSFRDRINIIAKLADLGYSIEEVTASDMFKQDDFETYPFVFVCVRDKEVIVRVNAEEGADYFNLETSDVVKVNKTTLFTPIPVPRTSKKLQLTSSYTAALEDHNLVVGCQSIPYPKVKELYDLCVEEGLIK